MGSAHRKQLRAPGSARLQLRKRQPANGRSLEPLTGSPGAPGFPSLPSLPSAPCKRNSDQSPAEDAWRAGRTCVASLARLLASRTAAFTRRSSGSVSTHRSALISPFSPNAKVLAWTSDPQRLAHGRKATRHNSFFIISSSLSREGPPGRFVKPQLGRHGSRLGPGPRGDLSAAAGDDPE